MTLKIRICFGGIGSGVTYACIEAPWRDDETVEHRLDLGDEAGDGRLLGLRRSQVLIALLKGL